MIEWEEKPGPLELRLQGSERNNCQLKVLRGGRLDDARAEDVGRALGAMTRAERLVALDIALESMGGVIGAVVGRKVQL